MSQLETRRALFRIPLEKWQLAPPEAVLYDSKEKDPFRYIRGDWNAGKTHLQSIKVGEDGESLQYNLVRHVIPTDRLEGQPYSTYVMDVRKISKENLMKHKFSTIGTNKPLISRQVRIT